MIMSNNNSGKPNCPICLNDITNPFYAHANNNGRRHPFHKQCLKRHIKSGRNSCPVCRVNLSRNNIQNILTPIVGPNANNYNQGVNSNANNNGNNGNNGRSNNNGNNGGSNNNGRSRNLANAYYNGGRSNNNTNHRIEITMINNNGNYRSNRSINESSFIWLYDDTSWFVPSRGLFHTERNNNYPRSMWDLMDWTTEIESTIFNYVMENDILDRFIGPRRQQALPTMLRFFDWLPDEDRARCYAFYYGSNNGNNHVATHISRAARQAYVDLIPEYIETAPNHGSFIIH